MNRDAFIKQLVAAKTAIKAADESVDAALLFLLGNEVAEEPGDDNGECDHPPNAREDIPVMNSGNKPKWFCKICGYIEGGEEDGA